MNTIQKQIMVIMKMSYPDVFDTYIETEKFEQKKELAINLATIAFKKKNIAIQNFYGKTILTWNCPSGKSIGCPVKSTGFVFEEIGVVVEDEKLLIDAKSYFMYNPDQLETIISEVEEIKKFLEQIEFAVL